MTNADTERRPLTASIIASNILKLEGILHLPTEPRPIVATDVDLEQFMRDGFVTLAGSAKTSDIIAFPREIKLLGAYEEMPDGWACSEPTLWVSCLLIDSDKARDAHRRANEHYFGIARGTWESQAAKPARVRGVGIYPLVTPTTEP